MKYTTLEAINRRLNGRLQVGGNGNTMGTPTVTSDLVLQVADQIESEMEALLRQRYRLPLLSTHPVLAALVEHGVCCQLLNQYQVGASDEQKTTPSCGEFKRLMGAINDLVLVGEVWVAQPTRQPSAFAGSLGIPPQSITW